MLHTAAARLSVRSHPDATVASLERAKHHMRRSIGDIRSVVPAGNSGHQVRAPV